MSTQEKTAVTPEAFLTIGSAFCDWFEANGRELPWRQTRDPYAIWVSEVMLQQTRVEAVLGYYSRFMEAFPTVEALAEASLEQVNHLWQGLGYYRRAALLHRGAQYICQVCGGRVPGTARELRQVPGIGAYTAGAVASFAYGEEVPAVDGNVLRVLARIYGIEENVDLPAVRRRIEEIAQHMIPPGRVWSHNQALMELGALVCIPGTPRCAVCPVAEYCTARARGEASSLPVKNEKKKPRVVPRTVYIVTDGQNILLHRRPAEGMLAGLWEFPGWPDEDSPRGLDPDTLPCDILFQREAVQAQHVFTHRVWEMRGVRVQVEGMNWQELDEDYRWIPREELKNFALPSAMRAFAAYVRDAGFGAPEQGEE